MLAILPLLGAIAGMHLARTEAQFLEGICQVIDAPVILGIVPFDDTDRFGKITLPHLFHDFLNLTDLFMETA